MEELRLGLYRHILRDCVNNGYLSFMSAATDEKVDVLAENLQALLEGEGGDAQSEAVGLKQCYEVWRRRHDPWVVVSPRDGEGREVDYVTRPRMEEERQETREWCEVREIVWPVSEPVPREGLRFARKRTQELYEAIPGMDDEAAMALKPIELLCVCAIEALYYLRATGYFAGFYSEDDDEALADIVHECYWTGIRTITAVS